MIAVRVSAAFLALAVGGAHAGEISLRESPAPAARIVLTTRLNGELIVAQGGKPTSLKLEALAEHRYRERAIGTSQAGGLPARAIRYYDDARAAISIDSTTSPRTLRPDRRLIAVERRDTSAISFSPGGALTREELELVGEHFDSLALTSVLPDKSMAIGGTWPIPESTAAVLCGLERLAEHDLTAKLAEANASVAVIAVNGSAKGTTLGARATVKVNGMIRFDLKSQRIVAAEWKQTDARDQGPASPAVNAEIVVTLTREACEPGVDLADVALPPLTDGSAIPESLTAITIPDIKGRYSLTCSRDWLLTSRSESNMVLRLLEDGEFVAQATITPWQKAAPGQRDDPRSFRDAMLKSPGWTAEQLLEESELPARPDGRRVIRAVARGQMQSTAVLQAFYLITDARGDQIVVAVTAKLSQAEKLAGRDAALVDGIAFPKP